MKKTFSLLMLLLFAASPMCQAQDDENIFIGALRLKGEDLVLSCKIASFVEVYGRRIPVESIPKVVVTFGNLRVNGEPVKSPGVEAVYPKDVPDYADAQADEGSVVIKVGERVEDRTERRVNFAEKKPD